MNETDTFEARIVAAAKILNDTPESFRGTFDARIGFDTVADLDDENLFKFGDFLKKFEDKPIGLVRKAFAALKGGRKELVVGGIDASDERTAQLRSMGFKTKLEDADVSLLLPLYRPDKPNDPITQALKKRYANSAVIAFNDDGSVAVTETVQYIADLEQGFPHRDSVTVGNQLVKLWPVGAKPNNMVEEDPLFPGSPLRNGYSIVNNRNWSNVPMERRQLCRIILERGDIDPSNKDAILRLLERAATDKGLVEVYPEADMEFRERKKRDELPKLKVELGGTTKPNNPFGVRRSY